jgi:hypothetical protein
MQIETIVLARVFDVQRKEASRYSPRRTDFSFEAANGMKRYAVQAPGWPAIEPGHRLTVVLERAGNWQTLAGWKNASTGEIVLPETGRSCIGVLEGIGATVMGYFLFAATTTPVGRVASAAVFIVCLLSTVVGADQWRRHRALANIIRQVQPALPTAGGGDH